MACRIEYEELQLSLFPKKETLDDLDTFDKIIVCSSGGKDSVACVLSLLEYGVPKDKMLPWHQSIDGDPSNSNTFMDWPITEAWLAGNAIIFEGIKLKI